MNSFMNDISIIVRLMRLEAERNMAQRGLGFPEQMVLMVLSGKECCNQDSIARALDIDKGAVARTVAKLEEKGLVSRETNPQNRRENIVRLLPPSRQVIGEMAEGLSSLQQRAFVGFSSSEQQDFEHALSRIAANLSPEERIAPKPSPEER